MTTIDELPSWTNEEDFRAVFAEFANELAEKAGAYSAESDATSDFDVAIMGHYGSAMLVSTLTAEFPDAWGLPTPIRVLIIDSSEPVERTFTSIEDAVQFATFGGSK